MMHGQKKHQNI